MLTIKLNKFKLNDNWGEFCWVIIMVFQNAPFLMNCNRSDNKSMLLHNYATTKEDRNEKRALSVKNSC